MNVRGRIRRLSQNSAAGRSRLNQVRKNFVRFKLPSGKRPVRRRYNGTLHGRASRAETALPIRHGHRICELELAAVVKQSALLRGLGNVDEDLPRHLERLPNDVAAYVHLSFVELCPRLGLGQARQFEGQGEEDS